MAAPIQHFGGQVERIWNDLRPITRSLVERAWQSSENTRPAQPGRTLIGSGAEPYDARSDWELGRLLIALDERVRELGASQPEEQAQDARHMAETCARVLSEQTQSAEVFAQLIARAQERNDYATIDALANTLASRLAPTEICELTRSSSTVVRAIAQDVLTHAPAAVLAALLRDPFDGEVARLALERQMTDYGTEEVRQLLADMETTGLSS